MPKSDEEMINPNRYNGPPEKVLIVVKMRNNRGTNVSKADKQVLIRRVLFLNERVIDVAKSLHMNYSNAKTILHFHKKKCQ